MPTEFRSNIGWRINELSDIRIDDCVESLYFRFLSKIVVQIINNLLGKDARYTTGNSCCNCLMERMDKMRENISK